MREDQIVSELAEWFGRWGYCALVNKGGLGYGVFTTEGSETKRKPDMLVWQKETGHLVAAIEVKNAEHSGNARRGAKILEYLELHASGEMHFYYEEKEVLPRYFLVASQFSPEGSVFDEKAIRPRPTVDRLSYPNMTPRQEYVESFSFVRDLWFSWKNRDARYALGVVLSGVNDGGPDVPGFFVMLCKDGRWKQRWLCDSEYQRELRQKWEGVKNVH